MKILIVAFFFGIALPVNAYYNPGQSQGFVNDFADMMAQGEEEQLEQTLQQFERETSNEIAVVTIISLGGDYIENFAEKLFSEWGIGKAQEDNGILLLVARDDREMRIEVGYGLEGALTDAQSNWIIQNTLKPAFQNEEYSQGILEAVSTIINATKGEYVLSDTTTTNDGGGSGQWEIIFWLGLFGFMWLSAILGRSQSWWAGGVIGGVAGVVIALIWGFVWLGIAAIALLIPFGLGFDYIVSKKYQAVKKSGAPLPWWIGGGRGGGFGGSAGGFGGFGGGFSGGGGASGNW